MSRFERARTSLRTWQKTSFRWSLRSRDGSSHGRFRLMVGIGAFSAAALASGLVAVPLAQAGGTWSGAVEVPGAATLNTGGNGAINAISCASAGNCSAIGTYGDTANGTQAFVVDETHGTWGSAQEVPGSGALNVGNLGLVSAIDCSSPGNCGAGGIYTDASKDTQSFVVNETGGTWGSALELPGSAALNVGGGGGIDTISCTSSGDCGVGGGYVDASKIDQSFVANESKGTWGSATEIIGVNDSGASVLNSLVCSSSGNCTAGGGYNDASNFTQSFVDTEEDGVWESSIEVPNTSLLNVSGNSVVVSVACSADEYCTAGGYYTDGSHDQQAFVVDETNGTWENAIEVPGTGTLNATGVASTTSMSCSADGSCSLGGFYQDAANNNQAFVDSAAPLFSVPFPPGIRVSPKVNGSALITVLYSVDNGGSPITQYQYSLDGGKWVDSPHHARTSFTVLHLKVGKTYRVAVRAVNIVGTSRSSASESFKIK